MQQTVNNPYIQDALQYAEQRSIAWDRARLGLFTGSGIADLMVQPKTIKDREAGNLSATAEKYVITKVMEMVTGVSQNNAYGQAIEWGIEQEENALIALMHAMECDPSRCNLKPRFKLFNHYSGASPDGIYFWPSMNMEVGIEVKCPWNSYNHYQHSRVSCGEDLKRISPDYYWQVQMNMLTWGLPVWIFGSYDPRQPEHRVLHWTPIHANTEDMQLMCEAMEKAQKIKEDLYHQWINK
jgi:hypothetical protein